MLSHLALTYKHTYTHTHLNAVCAHARSCRPRKWASYILSDCNKAVPKILFPINVD